MNKCLIIGYGTVGSNIKKELSNIEFDIVDKYLEIDTRTEDKYEFGFICVDTPLVNGFVDVTEVENAIYENDCDIYIIKSTVPVGFTGKIRQVTNKHIIFSPEYYGGTQHCNNFDFNFTILGGFKPDCLRVQQLLQNQYDATHRFFVVGSRSAEMVKFMENSWLATKVTFCNEFARACKSAKIDYETVRELFNQDPRVNPSHTFVYEDHPYYQSHCLDKDVPSIANQFDMDLLKSVIEINKSHLPEK